MLAIRRARADDLPRIVALLADDALGAAREDPGLPLDPANGAAFDAIDQDPRHLLAVAELHGVVVGLMQLTVLPGLQKHGTWRGQIESVRIASTLRGQGRGAEMMDWALAWLKDQGCGVAQLTSDLSRLDARRFYARLGFTASHAGMKRDL